MIYREQDIIIRDNFDLNDRQTLKTLANLNEAANNQVLADLCKKLYENIVDKVDDINFAEIDLSEGDITKIPNYNQLCDSIATMRALLKEFKQDSKPIDIISTALTNIIGRTEMFSKAYKLKLELPMITYSTLAASIVTSTSFLIACVVDFIKQPREEFFNATIDKIAIGKSRDHLLFRNLEKFNDACSKGKFDSCMGQLVNVNQKNLVGMAGGYMLGTVALVGLTGLIIPLLRELIYFYYYNRVKMSDFFDTQANLLQMNAYNLQNTSNLSKAERDKIVKKQIKIADNFRKVSDMIKVQCNVAERKATQDIANSSKKYKAQEVLSSAPDTGSSSSLF